MTERKKNKGRKEGDVLLDLPSVPPPRQLVPQHSFEKAVSELVGVFTDPILVFPGGWGDTLPDWLKTAITLERLTMNMKALKGEEMTGTDAEACAYLYTVTLTQPVDYDWTQIYLYIATQTYRRWGKNEMPDDIAVDSLNDYQLAQLKHFKDWLYQHRTKIRLEKERTERRNQKEAAKAQSKLEQPVLFRF